MSMVSMTVPLALVLVGAFLLLGNVALVSGAEQVCSKIDADWNGMKQKIISLKDESSQITQLTAELKSLKGSLNTMKTNGKYNLTEALHKSMLFFEAQRSGVLPKNSRVPWRHDSGEKEKGNKGENLSGGWYDNGGVEKSNNMMGFSVTMLSWGLIEYRDVYEAASELAYGLDCIKWPHDYFIKCHVGRNKFYGKMTYSSDKIWEPPQSDKYSFKAFTLLDDVRGNAVAGEMAAAMAAASIVFRPTDLAYADKLVELARELYDFGYNNKNKAKDMLAWAGLWLYKATGEQLYLTKVTKFVSSSNSRDIWYKSNRVGVQLLYYLETKDANYKKAVERFLKGWFPGGSIPRTAKGLPYTGTEYKLGKAASVAFLALVAADKGIYVSNGRAFAKSVLGYILGSTGRSFVVGFGKNPPVNPHHRAAACPQNPSKRCGNYYRTKSGCNPNVLYGALVSGPKTNNDKYVDDRTDYTMNSVGTFMNAAFQSAIAALLKTYM